MSPLCMQLSRAQQRRATLLQSKDFHDGRAHAIVSSSTASSRRIVSCCATAARFPDGTSESEWRLARVRDEGDVNADVRDEIAANGYCLFAIGLKLDVIRRSQRWQRSPSQAHQARRDSASNAQVSTLAAPGKRHYTFAGRKGPVRSDPLYMQDICRAYRTAEGRAHRLEAQDVALSRRKQGFDSPWARQPFQGLA